MPILTSQERIGTIVDGKYRLDRVLGEGGMGVVYDGVHLRLDRRVAVKFLHPQFSQLGDVVQRFMREAQATSRLQHPNVVNVFDVDIGADGCVFMVLEFLEGESFASLLERQHAIDRHTMLSIIGPVCDALGTAHAAGIVHRDIKPDNVYLSRASGGRIVPKVLDFGIAKLTDVAAGSATQTGSVMGTPLYMSPEQAMGRTREIGPRSDLWSTAVMTYEALAGRPPFDIAPDATATAVVLAVAVGEIHPLRRFKPELGPLSDVLDKALDRNVAGRYESLLEFRDALARACEAPVSGTITTQPGHGDPAMQVLSTMMAPAGTASPATRVSTPYATSGPVAQPTPPARSGRAMWLAVAGTLATLGAVGLGTFAVWAGAGAGLPDAAVGGGAPPPSAPLSPASPPASPPATPPPVVTPALVAAPPAHAPDERAAPPASDVAEVVDASADRTHRGRHEERTGAPAVPPPSTTAGIAATDGSARRTTTTTTVEGRAGSSGAHTTSTTPPPPTTTAAAAADPAPTHRAGGVSVEDF